MKILVCGPESSGKSTLARDLAWCLDGYYVAEAARAWLHARSGYYTEADLLRLLQLQREAERSPRARSASVVCCDTGPVNLYLWSQEKYGRVAPAIAEAVAAADYDLTLLCAPDLAYRPDPLREHPDPADRWRLYKKYRPLLGKERPVAVIRGHNRTAAALRALKNSA